MYIHSYPSALNVAVFLPPFCSTKRIYDKTGHIHFKNMGAILNSKLSSLHDCLIADLHELFIGKSIAHYPIFTELSAHMLIKIRTEHICVA